jgi:hypothetical protein
MTDDQERGGEIAVPVIGELVPVDDPVALGRALQSVRDAQAALREAGEGLTEAIIAIASVSGTKTLTLEDGTKLVVKGSGKETRYDAIAVEEELREAGMPEERIREIVAETVTYSVKAVELKRAAAVNEQYAEIMERHSTQIEKKPYVGIEPPPSRALGPAKRKKGDES